MEDKKVSIYEIDNKRQKIRSCITTKQLVMIGMLGAISTILMLFEFLIPLYVFHCFHLM